MRTSTELQNLSHTNELMGNDGDTIELMGNDGDFKTIMPEFSSLRFSCLNFPLSGFLYRCDC